MFACNFENLWFKASLFLERKQKVIACLFIFTTHLEKKKFYLNLLTAIKFVCMFVDQLFMACYT